MKIPKLTARHFALRAFAMHANKGDQDKMGLMYIMPDGTDEDRDAVQEVMEKMGKEFAKEARNIKPY